MKRHSKLLIAGLGNVGDEYVHTRHNIGFDIVDAWLIKNNLKWELSTLAFSTQIQHRGVDIQLIKPTTYMNLSGRSIKYWLQKHKATVDDLVVITDDIAFDLGVLKLHLKGNHGGHNGLRNIQNELQTSAYARLRCGIGNHFSKGQQTDFVLGKWKLSEQEQVNTMIENAVQALEQIIKSNTLLAMNVINKQVSI